MVAYSVEEGLDIAVSGDFDLVVVDLHMPTFSGIEFCRAVRGVDLESGGGAPIAGSTIAGAASVSAADRPRLLLHTTAAGSVKSDELEAFLEEGLVDKYVPQPLDFRCLLDFLEILEQQEEDGGGSRGLGAPFNDSKREAAAAAATTTRVTRAAAAARRWGTRAPRRYCCNLEPWQPSISDPASTFFDIESLEPSARAARQPTEVYCNRNRPEARDGV
ncbi:unnamed protein product [Ascophyllum nodosum]